MAQGSYPGSYYAADVISAPVNGKVTVRFDSLRDARGVQREEEVELLDTRPAPPRPDENWLASLQDDGELINAESSAPPKQRLNPILKA